MLQQKGSRIAGSLGLAVPVMCLGLSLGIVLAGPAGAAGSYDGVYKGTQRTLRTNNQGECARIDNDNMTIVIKDNHFTRKWSAELDVDVAADGTFDKSVIASQRPLRTAEIKGKIVGGVLEADIGTELCAGHLSLKKT